MKRYYKKIKMLFVTFSYRLNAPESALNKTNFVVKKVLFFKKILITQYFSSKLTFINQFEI